MITINNLEVVYGKNTALSITKPITFETNDRIGIIGANGAGKTTLVKAILGIISYKGQIITDFNKDDIAVHLQENNYVDTMTIKHIMEAILRTSIKKNKRLQELIEFFDMESCLKKKYSALSGGQKQRLTIILVLLQDAKLTFFDEVTSGLDFETRQQLIAKLQEWYRDKEATLCMVSHYYEELEYLVNKLLILDNGRIVDFGTKDELFEKYCRHAIIVIDNNERNAQITRKYDKIISPEHLIAITCEDEQMEVSVIQDLITHNVNFKRSNNDIEIMSINALRGGTYYAN